MNSLDRHAPPIRPWLLDLLVVGLPLLALYLGTASRDLGIVDSGELAVVCTRLGIAHPPGYPIYTLLGRLAVMLVPARPIVALNLLSAVIAAGAAWMAAGLARDLLSSAQRQAGGLARTRKDQRDPSSEVRNGIEPGPWIARAAGLWLGTGSVLWDQATGNEVYGLHLLFVVLLLRQALRLASGNSSPHHLLLLGWGVGISFAHHLSTAFLLPSLALSVAFFMAGAPPAPRGAGVRTARLQALAMAAVLAVPAWSIMLFLPIRSRLDPVLDWGDPTNWARFWRHAKGSQYSVWMFESGSQWAANLAGYLASLPARLSWPVVLGAVPGAVFLARRAPRETMILGLLWLATVAWASSYAIHDLAPYFLPADLVLVLFAATAASWLSRLGVAAAGTPGEPARGSAGHRAAPAIALAVAAGLAAGQAVLHFRDCDRSHDHFVRFHAESVLHGLPPSTILISRFWDAVVSPSLYLQEVERQRPDVTVVDTELLRRSWYYPQLARRDAGLFTPLSTEVRTFATRVQPFETGRPYDASAIEESYRAVIAGIAQSHRPARPTAYTSEVDPGFSGSARGVPEGLCWVLRDGPTDAAPVDPPDVEGLLRSGYRPADRIHRLVIRQWAQMIQARIRFLQTTGRASELPAWQAAWERLRPVAEALPRASGGTMD